MSKKNTRFHKDMMVGDVVAFFPEGADILMGYGLHCVGCYANSFETLEQGVLGHGYTPAELEDLIDDLNEAYEEMYENPSNQLSKESDKMEIKLTEAALEKIKEIAVAEKKDGYPLRIDAHPAGEKLKYSLNFVEPQLTTKNDKGFTFADGKVKIVVDKRLFDKLNGLEVDFVQEKDRAGFKMNNPNG